MYERSKKLRDYAIQYFTVDNRISCNCCSFNFSDFYGAELGAGFIEIHHTKPIFTLSLITKSVVVAVGRSLFIFSLFRKR